MIAVPVKPEPIMALNIIVVLSPAGSVKLPEDGRVISSPAIAANEAVGTIRVSPRLLTIIVLAGIALVLACGAVAGSSATATVGLLTPLDSAAEAEGENQLPIAFRLKLVGAAKAENIGRSH